MVEGKGARIYVLTRSWSESSIVGPPTPESKKKTIVKDFFLGSESYNTRVLVELPNWLSVNVSLPVTGINNATISLDNKDNFYNLVETDIDYNDKLEPELDWADKVLDNLIRNSKLKKFKKPDDFLEKEYSFPFDLMDFIYVDFWYPKEQRWKRGFTGFISEIGNVHDYKGNVKSISLKCKGIKGLLFAFPIAIGRILEYQEAAFGDPGVVDENGDSIYEAMRELVSNVSMTNFLAGYGPSDVFTLIMNVLNWIYTVDGIDTKDIESLIEKHKPDETKANIFKLFKTDSTGDPKKKFFIKSFFQKLDSDGKSYHKSYPDYNAPDEGAEDLMDEYYQPFQYSIDRLFLDETNPRNDDPVFQMIFENFNELYTSKNIDYSGTLVDRVAKSTMSYFYEDQKGNIFIEYPAYDHIPSDVIGPDVFPLLKEEKKSKDSILYKKSKFTKASSVSIKNSSEVKGKYSQPQHGVNYILDDYSAINTNRVDSEGAVITRVRVNQESEWAALSLGELASMYEGIYVATAESEYRFGIREKIAETLFYGGGFTYPVEVMNRYALALAQVFNASAKGRSIALNQRPDLLLNRTVYLPRENEIGLIVQLNHQIKVNGPLATTVQLKYLRSPGEKIINPWLDIDWGDIIAKAQIAADAVDDPGCIYPKPKGIRMKNSGEGSYGITGIVPLVTCEIPDKLPSRFDGIEDVYCFIYDEIAKDVDGNFKKYITQYAVNVACLFDAILYTETRGDVDKSFGFPTGGRAGPFTEATRLLYNTALSGWPDSGNFNPDVKLFSWLKNNYSAIQSYIISWPWLRDTEPDPWTWKLDGNGNRIMNTNRVDFSVFDSLQVEGTDSIANFAASEGVVVDSALKLYYIQKHAGYTWRCNYFNKSANYTDPKVAVYIKQICDHYYLSDDVESFSRRLCEAFGAFQIMFYPEYYKSSGYQKVDILDINASNVNSVVRRGVKGLMIKEKMNAVSRSYLTGGKTSIDATFTANPINPRGRTNTSSNSQVLDFIHLVAIGWNAGFATIKKAGNSLTISKHPQFNSYTGSDGKTVYKDYHEVVHKYYDDFLEQYKSK